VMPIWDDGGEAVKLAMEHRCGLSVRDEIKATGIHTARDNSNCTQELLQLLEAAERSQIGCARMAEFMDEEQPDTSTSMVRGLSAQVLEQKGDNMQPEMRVAVKDLEERHRLWDTGKREREVEKVAAMLGEKVTAHSITMTLETGEELKLPGAKKQRRNDSGEVGPNGTHEEKKKKGVDFCYFFQTPKGCFKTNDKCRHLHEVAPKWWVAKFEKEKNEKGGKGGRKGDGDGHGKGGKKGDGKGKGSKGKGGKGGRGVKAAQSVCLVKGCEEKKAWYKHLCEEHVKESDDGVWLETNNGSWWEPPKEAQEHVDKKAIAAKKAELEQQENEALAIDSAAIDQASDQECRHMAQALLAKIGQQ